MPNPYLTEINLAGAIAPAYFLACRSFGWILESSPEVVLSIFIRRALRSTLWLGAALFVWMGFLALIRGDFVPITGDAMDWKSQRLAGLHSVNCGRVGFRGDPSDATRCALDANAKRQPFRVTYQVEGWDSIVVGGIVRTPEGRLLSLTYDSCPSGCGFSLLKQKVWVDSCPEPFHLYVNPKGRINCFQPQLVPPSNIMSPNSEPY